jgi:hypothetical protein
VASVRCILAIALQLSILLSCANSNFLQISLAWSSQISHEMAMTMPLPAAVKSSTREQAPQEVRLEFIALADGFAKPDSHAQTLAAEQLGLFVSPSFRPVSVRGPPPSLLAIS